MHRARAMAYASLRSAALSAGSAAGSPDQLTPSAKAWAKTSASRCSASAEPGASDGRSKRASRPKTRCPTSSSAVESRRPRYERGLLEQHARGIARDVGRLRMPPAAATAARWRRRRVLVEAGAALARDPAERVGERGGVEARDRARAGRPRATGARRRRADARISSRHSSDDEREVPLDDVARGRELDRGLQHLRERQTASARVRRAEAGDGTGYARRERTAVARAAGDVRPLERARAPRRRARRGPGVAASGRPRAVIDRQEALLAGQARRCRWP